ncbi:hypothetical protein [Haladaptatus litoreus]|uniref:hypothetical protein n=1 Tax=Haladaptatus litoreus TaxID=553468 RepID=UPI0011155ACA|nr:hypothetical protein [Haladaptatus litoreus]
MLGLGTAALYAVGGTILAIAVFTLGGAVIMLHGYLIPGTPQLTRALPESILVAFGKNETDVFSSNLPATKALLAVGLLDEDYRLPDEIEERIQATAAKGVNDSDVLERAIVKKFDGVVEVSARRNLGGGENWFAFDTDEVAVRQWEARAVAALDMAVIDLLAERIPDWDDRSSADRTAMAALLRYGLQMCPVCGNEFAEPEGQHRTCCGGRSLVGERRCSACDYALVDQNDLPTNVEDLA